MELALPPTILVDRWIAALCGVLVVLKAIVYFGLCAALTAWYAFIGILPFFTVIAIPIAIGLAAVTWWVPFRLLWQLTSAALGRDAIRLSRHATTAAILDVALFVAMAAGAPGIGHFVASPGSLVVLAAGQGIVAWAAREQLSRPADT